MRQVLLKLIPLFLILLPMSSATSSMLESVSLAELRWQHRLIVAFSADGSTEDTLLKQWIQNNQCRLSDRDVIVFSVDAQNSIALTGESIQLDAASIQALNSRRQHVGEPYEILLIGKDGGVKASSIQAIELDSFIALIDTMPMRRREAAQGKYGC